MLKILKNLRAGDWFLMVLILGMTVLQVFCTMTLTDAIRDLTSTIMRAQMGGAGTAEIWMGAGVMVGYAVAVMVCQVFVSLCASIISSSLVTNLRRKLNDRIESMSMGQVE